ncbi:hypothetical protein BDN71DRAFT_1511874 [Pleurotus eryngii]|uniref:Uncharacterized protein n=1 Tax=Pleurotus eryngii TaxID=5323 RepID=A0A9P5ZL10_PLEER|nr:hypothetical protein BDN71DRAFT_1511874 [Pleurotus eryngii]
MFDYLEGLRSRLLATRTYIGSENALTDSAWSYLEYGNTWMRSIDGEIVEGSLMIVGTVASEGSDLGVMGTYDFERNNLGLATWHFLLEQPSATCFSSDFARAVFKLDLLQGLISKSGVNKGVVRRRAGSSVVAFGSPLFVKKGSTSVEECDEVWPVPYASHTRFRAMLDGYVFKPLRVTNRVGVPIPAKDWAAQLPGALVEVTFSLHHSYSAKEKSDDYAAWAKAVRVIKAAPEKAVQRTEDQKHEGEPCFTGVGPLDEWLFTPGKRMKGRLSSEGVA